MSGIAFSTRSTLARGLVDALPYQLTSAQRRSVREISDDLASSRSMNRLLQGDVGSGKTIVALIAMLIVVENGYQAVFLAPTEILAEQHFSSFRRLLEGSPVQVRLLVGARPSKLRTELLEEIQRGRTAIVVGTHALLEKDVSFAKLGLVVIDEQHRFGVAQRSSLRRKGTNPDVLVMTATPIPRTLSLTLYGDLDVSVIDELPSGRRPIRTLVREESAKSSVYQFVRDQVRAGRQAYFVYPVIEESETLDVRAATVHLEELRTQVFPDLRLGLLHGRMAGQEKDAVMNTFRRGEIDVLLATTVIEVGIDVPNATVMVIESADRFGLAQLHQLRGRVGRGAAQSFCILLTRRSRMGAGVDPDDESQRLAERRLAAMVRTTDGFAIAETDLKLRGPGDFFGTRQSGMPEFRVADLIRDGQILQEARADAFALIEEDPRLSDPSHRLLADDLRSEFRDELPLLQTG
jgi:ATP-dependent DNA helicase RecG